MDLVVDANILFAALIKNNITSELLLKREFHLYAPEFIFDEFEKYRDYLKKKTDRSDEDFDRLLDVFKRNIDLISKDDLQSYIEKAESISPDIKDVPYIAIALKLNIPIWSNDKALKKKLNEIKVYSTDDLFALE